jgi:hypothetical protein
MHVFPTVGFHRYASGVVNPPVASGIKNRIVLERDGERRKVQKTGRFKVG